MKSYKRLAWWAPSPGPPGSRGTAARPPTPCGTRRRRRPAAPGRRRPPPPRRPPPSPRAPAACASSRPSSTARDGLADSAQVRSASIRSRASCARGSACCASDTPRCSSRVRCRWPAVSSRQPPHAAPRSSPPSRPGTPAAPRRGPGRARRRPRRACALAGTVTPAADHRRGGVAAQPEPVERPGHRQPGGAGRHQPQGHRPGGVRAPAGGSTRRSCRPARPRSPSSWPRRAAPHCRRRPRHAAALDSGAQKCDRDPVSENASVDRWVPAATAVSVSLSPAAVSAATAA